MALCSCLCTSLRGDIYDSPWENMALGTNFSWGENSSEVCVVTQLIDYSSYFHQIFIIASADHDLCRDSFIGGEQSEPHPRVFIDFQLSACLIAWLLCVHVTENEVLPHDVQHLTSSCGL